MQPHWKLVNESMYAVAIQLVLWSCSNWLPIDAYVDVTMVVSIATRYMPRIRGAICGVDVVSPGAAG